MAAYTCDFCETSMSADDVEALIPIVAAHFEQSHAEYGIGLPTVHNYFDALERLTGPTERLDEVGPIETMPVGEDQIDDFLSFFDHDAFAGLPDWASCFCMFHHVGGHSTDEWGARTWQANRKDIAQRIRDGGTTGIVAHVDGKLVGWCNASLRSPVPRALDWLD